MTKVAYLFGTLDLQSTCDKWVAAAHYGKPSLTLRPRAGALDRFHGDTPLWSLVAMAPTRAISEGKLQGATPLWSLVAMVAFGNGCLWQPMQTFFYCDSHESQQRGKTPREKCWSKISKQNLINFLAILGNFEHLWFFPFCDKKNF